MVDASAPASSLVMSRSALNNYVHPRDGVVDAIDKPVAVGRCHVAAQMRHGQAERMHRLTQVMTRGDALTFGDRAPGAVSRAAASASYWDF
jgi:hypothetical protein